MKVCVQLHQGNMFSGGQGVYTHHLTRELVRLGHEVHLIVGPPWPDVAEGVIVHKVPSYSVYRLLETGRGWFYGRPVRTFFTPLNFYELATSRMRMFSVMSAFSWRAFDVWRRLQRQHRFDIFHDVQVLGYGTLAIKASGMPVVSNIHHPLQIDRANQVRQAPTWKQQIRKIVFYPFWMQEIVARQMDRIITGSGPSAESVCEAFRLPRERVRVIHDGVDVEVFRPLEVAKRPRSLLYVGNSDDRNKGARYLLEAMAILKARGFDCQLTFVDRPNAEMAPRMVSELGIEDRVTFTGRLSLENLVLAYNQAQLVVSPSLYEGFGLPAAEAMACGTPVIATTAGAFPEIVADGETGLLVRP
ncbi:MAG TPA: glycosyltransferase family 4 protein, partial [Dehalococcoidia bacterium]|nr:glycosyltransferase family 4 protein [Dehalococcoidia bacterium]